MTPAGTSSRRVSRLLIALASAVLLALGLLVVVVSPRAAAVIPVSSSLEGLARGVDASSWQHPHGAPVDWQAAADSGESYAFIKATEGTAPANRYYDADVEDARAAGMAVGSYHKARPATDPLAQARAFADRIQSVGGQQLPPVLDIEIDEGLDADELVDWSRDFLEETEALTGRTPIVYTYRHFWIDKTDNSTALSDYPLWLAEYDVSEPSRPMIGGWTEWLFWQRADDGDVPGFSGDVDLNVFAGSTDDLAARVGPVAPGAEWEPDTEGEPGDAGEAIEQPEPDVSPAPAEEVTIPVPGDIPAPEGYAVPEEVTVPGPVLDAARAGFDAVRR